MLHQNRLLTALLRPLFVFRGILLREMRRGEGTGEETRRGWWREVCPRNVKVVQTPLFSVLYWVAFSASFQSRQRHDWLSTSVVTRTIYISRVEIRPSRTPSSTEMFFFRSSVTVAILCPRCVDYSRAVSHSSDIRVWTCSITLPLNGKLSQPKIISFFVECSQFSNRRRRESHRCPRLCGLPMWITSATTSEKVWCAPFACIRVKLR